jgi:hypothetical protein
MKIATNLTPEQITYGNRLFANFEGGDSVNSPCNLKDGFLYYHNSWDWIMTVCRKWDNLCHEECFDIQNSLTNHTVYVELSCKLDDTVTCYQIEPVFEQLVINIEWYNLIKE